MSGFAPATRKGVKPLIGLYAESGCGKTYSALLLARGIAGQTGKVGIIDTESGRGSLYADVIPGGYLAMELTAPFSPSRYVAAIEAAEQAQLDVLVIDSMSHEWEGVGGVLDMAGDNEQKSGRAGLHNWKTPKLEHNKLVLKLLQSRLAIICCIRAKYKSRQTKDERGKTVIIKDDHVSPIQSEEFIFEMTAHAEIHSDHTITLTKCSHPELRKCFPKDRSTPLTIDHGAAISAWAKNPGQGTGGPQSEAPAAHSSVPPPSVHDPEKLRLRILKLAEPRFHEDYTEFYQWLWDEGILEDTESFDELSAQRLLEIGPKIKSKL